MFQHKKGILELVAICAAHGLRKVVISPGSRNAPLILAFNAHPDFECICIPDERVAAFTALGMAQQDEMPVILACTSGTAALNYAPAIAEAYYQHIPLLVLTADRPVEWTDQADGQTIRQHNLYQNYIEASYTMPQEPYDADTHWYACRQMNEAINTAKLRYGPVHVNMPFREPLYGEVTSFPDDPRIIRILPKEQTLAEHEWEDVCAAWEKHEHILIIAGQHEADDALNTITGTFAEGKAVILTETTANICHAKFIDCIDRTIFAIEDLANEDYAPTLLISFGKAVISKKIKAILRKWAPREHWHISEYERFPDTYKNLTKGLPLSARVFFETLSARCDAGSVGSYHQLWQELAQKAEAQHQQLIPDMEWSDMKAFSVIFPLLPEVGDVHLSNSTPVRYAQLFKQHNTCHHFANRGTSGIDGCTSTALGAARATGKTTTLITGDIAFFYDSNAFWQPDLPANLKVILIHNGGGGIFRIIDGPSSTKELEPFFESRHFTSSKPVAETYGVAWRGVSDESSLEAGMAWLYETNQTAILEIQTPPEVNDRVLKTYIKALKDHA